ncbi:MAG: nucleotidyltransferase domain-containing protein [Dietzia sp.]|nr:nucleotidyltransferase domain-containing protein [Dietzia sp.]
MIAPPDTYVARWTTSEYTSRAQLAAQHIERTYGHRIVAAGVTGSSLRGVWTASSDVDALVLVDAKLRKGGVFKFDGMEGQVQSIYRWAEILSTSVPYVEFQRSPWTVVAPEWAPFFRGVTVNWPEFEVHLERYARHLIARPAVNPEKTARVLCCLHHLKETGSPLCPRDFVHPNGQYPHIAEWARSICPDIPEDVLTHLGPGPCLDGGRPCQTEEPR